MTVYGNIAGTKCELCLGCNRLESPNFKGDNNCTGEVLEKEFVGNDERTFKEKAKGIEYNRWW